VNLNHIKESHFRQAESDMSGRNAAGKSRKALTKNDRAKIIAALI
jgi:hypothetical protein